MAVKAIAAALALVGMVNAHGHIATVIVDGTQYNGADPSNPTQDTVGWPAANQDNGYVAPDAYGSPDIICHKQATAGTQYVSVAAGGSMSLMWNTWPDTHHGPVLDYLASCNGDCTTIDKTTLSFAKIDQQGLIDGSNPGHWATDDLIANGFTWTVTIPASVAPGKYVLRHEIIALHSAAQPDGAQNYPQCINLEVTAGGSSTPSGTPATQFYSETDPSIVFNLYQSFDSYDIPGPELWQG